MALALPGLIPSQEKPANPTAKLQPPCVEPVSAYPQLPILVQEETLLLDAMCQLWGKKINKKSKSGPSEFPEFVSPALTAALAAAVPTWAGFWDSNPEVVGSDMEVRSSWKHCKHWICLERDQASLAQNNGSF